MSKMRGYVDKIRCIYLMILTVYTLMREVIPAQIVVGMSIVTYGIFGLGILVVLASVSVDRDFFRVRNIVWMGLFLAVCIVSSMIHYKYALVDNVKAICWMILFFCLAYPSGNASAEKRTGEIPALFFTSVTVMAGLMFVSLPMFFFNVDYTYYNTHLIGEVASQGFSNKFMRLWGVFGDANTGAVYAGVTLFMACYLFTKYKNRLLRVFLSACVILFAMYIVLSGSRTVQVAMAAAFAWVVFYSLIADKKKVGAPRILMAIACAGLAACVSLGATLMIRSVLPYARNAVFTHVNSSVIVGAHDMYKELYMAGKVQIISNYEPSDLETDDKVPGDTLPGNLDPESTQPVVSSPVETAPPLDSLDRTDVGAKGDISNGRISKWLDALEIFSYSPIIGASPRGIMMFGRLHCPDNEIAEYGVAAHNFLLEVLMGTGLIGFVLLIIILFRTVLWILQRSVAEKFSTDTMFVGAMAMNLVCASIFLSDLVFVLTFGGVSFWYALGCLNCRTQPVCEDRIDDPRKRVLIYGPKDPVGGVEKIVFDYVRNVTQKHEDISFDYLQYGDSFSMEEDLKAIGCRVLYVPSRKANMKAYKRAMENVFRDTPYIAVWGNYSGLTNIDLLVLAKKYGVPMRIAHSHGSRLYWGSPIMKYVVCVLHYYNKIFRLTGYATHYWACSDVAGRFMFPRSIQKQITIIPNAVDTKSFYPDRNVGMAIRQSLNIPQDSLLVGHVARICEVKNQLFLLRIIAELIKIRPDAKLLFVGDGELRQQIEDQIRTAGLQENVIMTGNRNDVPDLLRAMDVFVLTSFSEGLSVSAVEAQASGLPCIVPTTVSPETDLTGHVTFLSLEDSPRTWAEAIVQASAGSTERSAERILTGGHDIAGAAEQLYGKLTEAVNQVGN